MTVVRAFTALAIAFLLQGVAPAGAASNAFSISGFVWMDGNANKLPSIWEPKLPGVGVKLMNSTTNAVIRTATTNAAGNYVFSSVSAGNYKVGPILPPGYAPTTPGMPLNLAANAKVNFGMAPAKSIEEKALNAFGDRWSLAKANPTLQRAAGTGCYRKPAPGMGTALTEQELQFQKQQAARFYVEACAVILETDPPFWNETDLQSTARLLERVTQFKAAYPTAKYLGFVMLTDWNAGQVGWTDIYDNHRNWFVYKKGSTAKNDANIVLTKSGARLMDLTNPAYQDYIATRLAQALVYYKIDGLFIDLVSPVPIVRDISVVPDAARAAWGAGWVAILTKVKAALGPNRLVFASVQKDNIAFAPSVIPVVDGIMIEDTFSPVRNDIATRMSKLQPAINAAAAAGKWILTTQNTKVDGSTFATTSPQKERAYARYYLAAFYIFNKGKMLFYYNPPSATVSQYGAEAFFTDWNIKVGGASSPYAQIAGRPGVYKRNYGNAIIYLNTTTSKYKITVPANSLFKFDPDGNAITSYNMPAKSGFILSRAQAFQ